MATRDQVSDVLRQHAERLRRRGAHALATPPGKAFGLTGYVIEAYVTPDFEGTLPEKVSATVGGKTVDVPILVTRQGRFKAEI
jgi:hypothetical protein